MTLLALFTLFSACSDDSPITPVESEGELSILPLGDSRVEGARPEFESYRFELWKNLVSRNYDFDLVGPEQDGASYPSFMNQTFDNDHAGVGGDQTGDVLRRLGQVLSAAPEPPDVVLLGIGGNDLLGGRDINEIITNLNEIIDRLQNSNDSVTIFLEQIAPGRSDINTPNLQALFSEFNQEILNVANQQTNSSSRIIVVDMASNWNDRFMADEVHYNEEGAQEVANRYFSAIETHIEP